MPPARPVTTSSAPQRVRKSAANAQKGTPRAKAASSEVASVEQVDTSYLQTLMGYNARRAALAIISVFLERMAPYGLRPVDFSVLSLIAHNPGITSRQLCGALDILPPNLVAMVNTLEKRGLIVRKPHPRDGRAVGLHLTPAGRKLLQAAEQTASNLGLTRTTRFVNVLELGVMRNSSNEAPTQRGWEIGFELPLFDWGDARVAK